MNELTVKELMGIINALIKEKGKEVLNYKIVIGDDEELNGVHQAYYCQDITKKDIDDFEYCNYNNDLDTKTILIS